MGFDERELSRVRVIANAAVAVANRSGRTQTLVIVKRTAAGARLDLTYRSGTPKPGDPLSYLGDLADTIRNELRLERGPAGEPMYRTGESTFSSGDDPSFTFDIWQ